MMSSISDGEVNTYSTNIITQNVMEQSYDDGLLRLQLDSIMNRKKTQDAEIEQFITSGSGA